ncbi:DUF6894 family protein [Bradyrhizobium sp. URHC0002]
MRWRGHSRALIRICITNGELSSAAEHGIELSDRDSAWKELTRICGGLVGSLSRNMKQGAEWQIELLDEFRKPLLRMRLVSEALE